MRTVTDNDAMTHTEHGDAAVAKAGEILRTEVGSGLHGIAVEGTADHDEMGVYIEPPECVIGLRPPMDHYVFRTRPEGHRSGPGDTDLVMYSLRKYLKLATEGNPTVLLPLFAPQSSVYAVTEAGRELRESATAFLSRTALRRFIGYMDGQGDRMLGIGRRSDVPNRPELVERHGYDVKFASHALRLAYQGLEIAEHARLTLPMPPSEREHVRAVKSGRYDQETVLTDIAAVRERIVNLLDKGWTPIPEEPDRDALSAWSVEAHQRFWATL